MQVRPPAPTDVRLTVRSGLNLGWQFGLGLALALLTVWGVFIVLFFLAVFIILQVGEFAANA